MSSPLTAFQGDALYLDTVILVGLLDANSVYHSACAAFFQRAVDAVRPIHFVTATLTLDELIFVLLQEMVARPPYGIVRSRSRYLHNHPAVVRALMAQLDPVVEALFDLVTLEPVLATDIRQMYQEMRASGILPRDAIHLAVMRRLGLEVGKERGSECFPLLLPLEPVFPLGSCMFSSRAHAP